MDKKDLRRKLKKFEASSVDDTLCCNHALRPYPAPVHRHRPRRQSAEDSMTTLRALRLCDTVPARLARVSRQRSTQLSTLRVHSVFRHACNLVDDRGYWLSLQASGMPLAPRGIIVDLDALDTFFAPGQSVWMLSPMRLQMPRLTLDIVSAEHCDTRLITVPDDAGWQILATQLPIFLSLQPPAQ